MAAFIVVLISWKWHWTLMLRIKIATNRTRCTKAGEDIAEISRPPPWAGLALPCMKIKDLSRSCHPPLLNLNLPSAVVFKFNLQMQMRIGVFFYFDSAKEYCFLPKKKATIFEYLWGAGFMAWLGQNTQNIYSWPMTIYIELGPCVSDLQSSPLMFSPHSALLDRPCQGWSGPD